MTITSIDSDNAVTQYQQSVAVAMTSATETILSGTLGGVSVTIVEADPTDGQVSINIPGSLTSGVYDLTLLGATETHTLTDVVYTQTHKILAPYEAVDSNSAYFGQTYDAGTYSRVVTLPTHGVLNTVKANAEGLWANDVREFYTANGGFEGYDAFTMEELYPDGTVSADRTVSLRVGLGVGISVAGAYTSVAGRSHVTLSGWTGGAAFLTTPVAGDQLEYPDALTVSATGDISGPADDYVIHHTVASTGITEAMNYSITEVTSTFDPPATYTSVTLSGTVLDDAKFAVQPVVGDQVWYPPELTVDAQLGVTAPFGNHTIYHVTADGTVYTVDYAVAPSLVASYVPPAGKTLTTLEAPVDPYLFESWPRLPVAPEQFVTTTSEGILDVNGNWEGDVEGVFDVWFIEMDGTVRLLTVDTTGLAGPTTVDTAATFSFGTGLAVTVLEEPIEHYLDQDWGSPAEANEQVVYDPLEATFDVNFNLETDVEGLLEYHYVNNDGVVYTRQIDTTDLAVLSVSETVTLSTSGTISKVAVFDVAESVALSTAAALDKDGVFDISESVSLDTSASFDKTVEFSVGESVSLSTEGTLASHASFDVSESVTLSTSATLMEPIISSGSSGVNTLVKSKTVHTVDSYDDSESIEIIQGAWRQLEFPIHLNGSVPTAINAAKFVLYLDGAVYEIFELEGVFVYLDGSLILALDESFTELLDKHYYQFELWFTDTLDNPHFVMKGEFVIKHTKVRF